MVYLVKVSVYYDFDHNPCLLDIKFFGDSDSVKRYFSLSTDWFFSMISNRFVCHNFENISPLHDCFYFYDRPDFPRCLAAVTAIMEENMKKLKEYGTVPL